MTVPQKAPLLWVQLGEMARYYEFAGHGFYIGWFHCGTAIAVPYS